MILSSESLSRLRHAKRIVALTGAGISAGSGIPSFRGRDGLWKSLDKSTLDRNNYLMSLAGFRDDPIASWRLLERTRLRIARTQPNASHRILAELEETYDELTIVTLNIDGLHQLAGSKNVVELHGNIWNLHCGHENMSMHNTDMRFPAIPPRCCRCGEHLRPGVVLGGEYPRDNQLRESLYAAKHCDVMLVIGLSGTDSLTRRIFTLARSNRTYTIEINPEMTEFSSLVDEYVQEKSETFFPKLRGFLSSHHAPRSSADCSP